MQAALKKPLSLQNILFPPANGTGFVTGTRKVGRRYSMGGAQRKIGGSARRPNAINALLPYLNPAFSKPV
jgi:hypothetical protein